MAPKHKTKGQETFLLHVFSLAGLNIGVGSTASRAQESIYSANNKIRLEAMQGQHIYFCSLWLPVGLSHQNYLLFYSTDTNLTQGRPGAISSIGPDYRKASGNSTRKAKNSARNSGMWRLRTVLDIGTASLTVSEMCFFSKSFRPSLGILSPARKLNACPQSVDSNLAAALTGVGMNWKP